MSIRCWDELVKYGVDKVLQREYGDRVKAEAEPDYNVSLELDLEKFPPEGGKSTGFPLFSLLLTLLRRTQCTGQVHLVAQA